MIYLLLLILVFCWTLNPFFKKILMKKMNPYEYFFINNLTIFTFLSIYLISLKVAYNNNNVSLSTFKTLSKTDLLVLFIGSALSILATFMFLYLIRLENISTLIPHTQSLIMILTMVIGYLFFKENIFKKDIVGIMLIVSGITLIKYKKN